MQREARRRAIAFPMPEGPCTTMRWYQVFFIERAIVKGIGGEAVKAEAHALTLRRL